MPDHLAPGSAVASSADAPGSPRRRWLFRALAMGMVAALAVVLVFAYQEHIRTRRVYLVGEPGSGMKLLFDPQLGWRNIANDDSVTHGQKMTTNSHGFRGPEVSRRKPPGTKRILILGDSFAWGLGVADHEVFARVLQTHLESLPTRWEVLNAGVSGWGTDQEFLHLVQEGFDFEPDIVVLAVFLANDHEGNATSRMYQRNKPVFLDLDLELAGVPVPRPGEDAPQIGTRAHPVRLTAAIVNRMATACEEHDCAFVPTWFGNYMAPRYAEADNRFFREAADLFVSLLPTQAHVYPMDLDAGFAGAGATYDMLTLGGADRHWNATGHEITAELVWRHLRETGLLD